MAKLSEFLEITSCPHCGKPNPSLQQHNKCKLCFLTTDHKSGNMRWWSIYFCRSCGGVVTASAPVAPTASKNPLAAKITEIYPSTPTIDDSIPKKALDYLRQAQESLHAPAGAIMLCASAVDAMLKEKNYTDGTLNERIDKAAKDHLITDGMAQWAHQIRLDANEQRHADEDVGLPTNKDAKLTFDFAIAFAEYLFVIPSKVTRGIAEAGSNS
jgi:hypothetical protein